METFNSKMEEAYDLFCRHEYSKAFDLYRQCSEEGDKLSLCRMGEMYYEGHGVDRRPFKAFLLIKDSFDPDYPETVFQMGKCHFEGIGTSVEKDLGFEMIISMADIGYPPAENYVAALYLEGDYVSKNIDKGLEWLNKAVEHEDPKALCNMADLLFDGTYVNMNRSKAMKLWKRSSEMHYTPALCKMGIAYLRQTDLKDTKKGLDCLERGTSLDDGIAAERLADYYVEHSKGQECIDKAIGLYNIALKNGNKRVLYDLGMMYNSVSENKDRKKAFTYFKEGYENGDQRCAFDYAFMMMRGVGTDRNEELAFKVFLEGAEKGKTNFMGWVGHCYHYGEGVNPDEYAAREWFERGYNKGDAYCTLRLAEFYFHGLGGEMDRDFSLRLLRKSFKKGEAQAAEKLGYIYENNHDLKSIPDSIYWYMAGAEKGDCTCMMKLASHYESGAFITKSEEKAFRLYQDAYKAENSSTPAAEIGRCFEEGVGTEPDIKAAVNWYLRAAKRNAFAMWRLYNICIDRKETEKAVFWLRRSAAKGSVSAMVELAKIYEEGKLVPKSDYMAMQWYHRASDEGDEYAKSRFEELIRYDPQDNENIDEYEKAVRNIGEDSFDEGIMYLGMSLTEGLGMPVDLPKARMWYEIASQLGMHDAKDAIKRVDSLMKNEKNISDKQTTLD